MREVVLHRWTSGTFGVAAATILWALFVVPSANPWAGHVWMTALGLLALSTVVLCVGVGSSRMTGTAVARIAVEPVRGKE